MEKKRRWKTVLHFSFTNQFDRLVHSHDSLKYSYNKHNIH